MIKKLYCAGAFDFDYQKKNYKKQAKKDYRVVSILKDLDTFLYGCKTISLSKNLNYIGPFYCETDTMQGDEVVNIELKAIENCTDGIFVLDRANCPGTIFECTYAATLKKNLHIFYLQKNEDEETESKLHTPCWFAIMGALNINPKKTHLYTFKDKKELYTQISDLINQLK